MNILPRIRKENIVVQHTNDEVLIYFFDTNKAVCLNSTSAIVFNHCDGKTTFGELKSKYNLTDDLIYFTLDKLNENNILKEYQANTHFAGLSRRDVIKRVGMGSMVALPVIAGLLAPSAAHASSQGLALNSACTAPNTCQSNRCVSTLNDNNPSTPSGNMRCCIASPSNGASRTEPGTSGSDSITGQAGCTANNSECCDGTSTFQQDPAQAPGRGTCIC